MVAATGTGQRRTEQQREHHLVRDRDDREVLDRVDLRLDQQR